MNCCICKKEINKNGNNPSPFCLEDDYPSICCDECNREYVIPARVIQLRGVKRPIKENDFIVVFCSKNSDKPIEVLVETGRMLAGYATDNKALPANCWEGSWGNFLLNEKEDSFVILER